MIDSLCTYFKSEGKFSDLGLKNLSENYTWPKNGKFPNYEHIFQAELTGESLFERNVSLKRLSPAIWKEADKFQLANWIIRDWGGIRGNKTDTIRFYLDEISSSRYPSELKGVASYSKILSFMDPRIFAIYDARVAISLNAIQLLEEQKEGAAFCYLPGRNVSLNRFRVEKSTHISALSTRGWKIIKPDDCYNSYLNLLRTASDVVGNDNLYELEMALFADAEKLSEMYLRTVS